MKSLGSNGCSFVLTVCGGAMIAVARRALVLAALHGATGWWSQPNVTEPLKPNRTARPALTEDPANFAIWLWNSTRETVVETIDEGFSLPQWVGSWDSWIWTGLDLIISAFGWMIFGSSWTRVKGGFTMLLRLVALLTLCVAAHYVLALCWPMVSLVIALVMTLVWLVKAMLKLLGRVLFFAQRWSGGVPESVGAEFFGPGTGEAPETSELRRLKKGATEEKWVLVRRDGHTAIFRVASASSIKSSGIYLDYDPETLRGSQELLLALKGYEKVHLCRNDHCLEEGQHFKQYAVVKPFNAEKFQVASSAQEAKRVGSQMVGWFCTGAAAAARKARDLASESETEVLECGAHRVQWETDQGQVVLCSGVCKNEGTESAELLVEDRLTSNPVSTLCPKHSNEYRKKRFQLKCVVESCDRLGEVGSQGFRLCAEHAKPQETRPSEPSRRKPASRSRSRSRTSAVERGGDPGYETEEEYGAGLRRRVRVRDDSPEGEPDEHRTQQILEEIREDPPSKVMRMSSTSPGRTPRSAVQKSLAKLGMINSPDRRVVQTTLEEFMEQFVDGKELDLTEEDIRRQMASQYGLSLEALTANLYEQAVEEQRKGTKGLTKFLAKWRKQAAAAAKEETDRSRADSWSLVGDAVVTPSSSKAPGTPSRSMAESSSSEKTTPVKPRTLAVMPPPGIYGVSDRKAGTGETEPIAEIARAIQQQTTELASLVKTQTDNVNVPSGTIKSLGRTSEELVFLLRACGQYTVQVGDGEYGAGLANALIAAQAGASTKLRAAGFRQKVTPRLAVGLAGPFWGTQEKYALSASDFVPCTDAELDQFAIESRTGKPMSEQRPPAPTRYEDWVNRVKRQTDIWALTYGAEWRAVREHAATMLGEGHLETPHKWPLQVLCEVWEELHWRFCEELKEELRKIKKLAGRETMTLQDLKFYALMPDSEGNPPLKLPNTFDLKNPGGWFATEVLPRIERRQERMLWKLTWEGGGKHRGQGQSAGGEGAGVSREDKITVKSLLGPKLTPEETNRAKERAPVDKEGKLLCWGFISHVGCNQPNCQRSHEHLRGTFEALDPTVQMQILKRGGLRRMKAETKETATEKIKEIRTAMAKDKAAKVKDGQDRRRAGQDKGTKSQQEEEAEKTKAGGKAVRWAPPEEMVQVDYTPQEEDFASLVKGPDSQIFKNITVDGKPHEGRGGESAPTESLELVRQAQRLMDGPVLRHLQGASDDLYAWASTRVANDPEIGLTELLEDMVQFGLGELAAEAASLMEEHMEIDKAGSSRRCHVGDTHWKDEGPGLAVVEIDGKSWTSYDYREEIYMTEELAGLMGALEVDVEKRQCVTKVLAAGCLVNNQGGLPSFEQVEELGQRIRLEQARQAVEAEGIMGHPEPKVSAVEYELRMYSHDVLKSHHDKDYRALAVFPLQELEDIRVLVIRVDYKGDILLEAIAGTQWGEKGKDIWALIWRGHMTLLIPPDQVTAAALVKEMEPYVTPCLGFHYFWHQRHDQPLTSPGIAPCRLCKPLKKAGADGLHGLLRKSSCLPILATVMAGGPSPVRKVRPVVNGDTARDGLVLQEFFAGHGVLTKGWEAAGGTALEPIELYQEPHLQRGRRELHDLADPANQQRFLKGIQDGYSNVEWIACPCTTFCDWNLQNGGTRTFTEPAGKPSEKEALGNSLSTFGAELFEASLQRKGFPIAESSGPSGRYPKQWNLPAWQRILRRPDVDFIEIDMCAFRLGPPQDEAPGQFYRHRTGLAFPHHPPLRQALLRLCLGLSADHQHIALKGARPGSAVSRCTEAGVYAADFVKAVVTTLQQTLVGGGSLPPQVSRAGSLLDSPILSEFAESSSTEAEETEEGSTLRLSDLPTQALTGVWANYDPSQNPPTSSTGPEVEGPTDTVNVDMSTGEIRINHVIPRHTLYVPGGIGFPHSLDNIRDERATFCTAHGGPVDGYRFEVVDNWRQEGEKPTKVPLWTGYTILHFTGFDMLKDVPEDENEEGPRPGDDGDEDGEEEDYDPDEDEEDGGGAGDSEPGPPEQKRQRTAGAEDSTARGCPDSVKEAAQKYIEVVDNLEGQGPRAWASVCNQGNALLEAAGSVQGAAEALWLVREEQNRNNLAGVDDPGLDNLLHPDHLAYLREVRQEGMAARFQGSRTRTPSRLHPRARENLDQVYAQLMKDIYKHRVLVVSSNHGNLSATVSSPFETVPKMLPNRSLSKEMRLVHDQRRVNQGTDKELHPPAAQPMHEQIARRILWLKARYPKVDVVMAKKDVAGAFRLLWVAPQDVELFGGDVPWQPEFMGEDAGDKGPWPTGPFEQGMTLLYLVSSFGFSGSPGEWAMWGRATEELHRAHRPAEPRRDGALHFDGKILVDDMVLVEPKLGVRPWVSSEVYEWGVVKLLGEKAVNKVKDAEEGQFEDMQTVWGVCIDARRERVALPEARILKGAYLLAGADFNYGAKTLTLKDLQRFRGIATGWAAIVSGLQNELKSADVFLGGMDGGAQITPKLRGLGQPHREEQQAWEDLWELFEDCRWLCARSETWAEKFGGDLKELLPPRERLALPGGVGEGAVFVSSDSTLQVLGAIDWTNKLVCREKIEQLKPWVQKVLELDTYNMEIDMAIHIGEMLSFVAFACKVGQEWSGKVVVFGSDNKIVFHWILSRRSKVRSGRLLVRVLNLVERRFRCRILGGWWRTFHNEDADALTRLDDEEVQKKIEERGWEVVDIKESIFQALEDTERFGACFLSWADQEDRYEMMRLHELRVFRTLCRQPQDLGRLQVHEWTIGERLVKDFEYFGGEGTAEVRVIAATIGPDPHGKIIKRLLQFLETETYEVVVVEGPREVAWSLIARWAVEHGKKSSRVEFLTSEMGDSLVRRRMAVFVHSEAASEEEVESYMVKSVTPPSIGSVLGKAEQGSWKETVKFETAVGPNDQVMLPLVGGHAWFPDEGERRVVYRASGPGRWPLFKGSNYAVENIYVLDKAAPPGYVRKLTGLELWKAQGRGEDEWHELVSRVGAEEALKEGLRATGRRTALALLGVVAELAQKKQKAGMCFDKEDYKTLGQLITWLRRWRRGELARAPPDRKAGGCELRLAWFWGEELWILSLEEDDECDQGRRAGGRHSRAKAEEKHAEKFVKLGKELQGDLDVQAQVEDWLEQHMCGDKAVSTQKAYKAAWDKWCDWSRRQGWLSPFLSNSNDTGTMVENENKVLGFIGYLGWLGTSVASLKQAIFAIKDAHKRAGHGDSTGKMHRLWIVLNSLERNAVKRPRRLGVTVAMLKWIGEHLHSGGQAHGDLKVDCRMLKAALLTAWFYMLRAKEFCDSSGVDMEMVVRGQDIQLSVNGNPVEQGAEEATLQFRKTKADQTAFGTCKTMLRTGVNHVCVVEALEHFKEVAPRRFGAGPEAHLPLFRWSSGQVVKRLEVQNILQRAAKACGLPADRFQSHSLRIGGASALYQATGEVEVVKRTGRWTSSAVQRYLHDSGDVLKGLSKKMATVDQFVHYT